MSTTVAAVSAWQASFMPADGNPSYLYFVTYASDGRTGYCYADLGFAIESMADAVWLQDEARRHGLTGAVIRSYTLLYRSGMGG